MPAVKSVSSLHCQHHNQDGAICAQPAGQNGLCYWHDRDTPKRDTQLCDRLRAVAEAGHCLEGYSLKRANLKDVNLVKHGSKAGYSLKSADLYRADLEGAHLFNVDFRNASLMKANLTNANLHCADLRDCNLLGVNLSNARIENVEWGERLLQEKLAMEALKRGEHEVMMDYLEQAEEIYRNLRKTAEVQGLFEISGKFFYKEMVVRRQQMPRFSFLRAISYLVDLFCGYGEKPLRVILFSLFLIAFCAVSYFTLGIYHSSGTVGFSLENSMSENLISFLECLYFSVVTFTTLGYGDLVPIGAARPVAAFEAFTGNFTIALFVVVFVKKMTR